MADLSALIPQILQAIIPKESGGNPNAYNSQTQAKGLTQITPALASDIKRSTGKSPDLSNPQGQLTATKEGLKVLAQQLQAKGIPVNADSLKSAWLQGAGGVSKNGVYANNVADSNGMTPVAYVGNQPQGQTPNYVNQLDALTKERQQNAANRVAEEKGLLEITQRETQNLPQYEPEDMPVWKPLTSPVSTKEYQQFTSGLLAMGLIFGARGGTAGFQAAAESINGAMQGYLQGNLELAKQKQQEFDNHFKTAMEKARQSQERIKSILDNKQLTLSMLANQLSVLGHEYDRQDLIIDGQERNVIQAMNHYDQMQMALERLQDQRDFHKGILAEKEIERAQRQKEFEDKLRNSGVFPATVSKQLSVSLDAVQTLSDLKKRALEDPRVLQVTTKVPGFSNAEDFIKDVKAGDYPVPLRTTQDQELYDKQVEYWKDVSFAVEKLAAAQGGSRAFSFIRFMLSIKPGSSDDPHLALHQLDSFIGDSKKAFDTTLKPYEATPKYSWTIQSLRQDMEGIDTGPSVPDYGTEVPPSIEAPTVKELNGKKYIKRDGKWYEE